MQVSDFKTFVVGNPPPHHGGRYWVFVKLVTDSGIVGYGEVYSVPFHPHVVAEMIADVCSRYVLGADPFKIERLWRTIYSSGYTQHPDLSLVGVLSGRYWSFCGRRLRRCWWRIRRLGCICRW